VSPTVETYEAIPQLSLGDDGQPMPRFGACAHLDDLQADSPHVRRERLSTPSEAYISASINYEIALRKIKRIQRTSTLLYNWYRAVSGWDAATLRES